MRDHPHAHDPLGPLLVASLLAAGVPTPDASVPTAAGCSLLALALLPWCLRRTRSARHAVATAGTGRTSPS